VQAIAGDLEGERVLLRLYDELRQLGHRLVCAGNAPLGALGIKLPDLQSRLGWGLVFHIQALRDRDKISVLRRRSEARGFELPLEAAQYLLARCPRDMATLCGLLDRLDELTLKTHRRLTIPLVKTILDTNR
jgi:DnaA family protein